MKDAYYCSNAVMRYMSCLVSSLIYSIVAYDVLAEVMANLLVGAVNSVQLREHIAENVSVCDFFEYVAVMPT